MRNSWPVLGYALNPSHADPPFRSGHPRLPFSSPRSPVAAGAERLCNDHASYLVPMRSRHRLTRRRLYGPGRSKELCSLLFTWRRHSMPDQRRHPEWTFPDEHAMSMSTGQCTANRHTLSPFGRSVLRADPKKSISTSCSIPNRYGVSLEDHATRLFLDTYVRDGKAWPSLVPHGD